jgi:hypothetical protein
VISAHVFETDSIVSITAIENGVRPVESSLTFGGFKKKGMEVPRIWDKFAQSFSSSNASRSFQGLIMRISYVHISVIVSCEKIAHDEREVISGKHLRQYI